MVVHASVVARDSDFCHRHELEFDVFDGCEMEMKDGLSSILQGFVVHSKCLAHPAIDFFNLCTIVRHDVSYFFFGGRVVDWLVYFDCCSFVGICFRFVCLCRN